MTSMAQRTDTPHTRFLASEADLADSLMERMAFTDLELRDLQIREWEAEAAAEMAAEGAYVRYLEDRGYDDARETDMVEAARGVVQFDVAMREAERAGF